MPRSSNLPPAPPSGPAEGGPETTPPVPAPLAPSDPDTVGGTSDAERAAAADVAPAATPPRPAPPTNPRVSRP